MTFSQKVKDTLFDSILTLTENKDTYVLRPGIDFSRNKKMSLEKLIQFTLSMEGNSIEKELLDFSLSTNSPTISKSAFIQSRAKLKWEAFEFLFRHFTGQFKYENTFKGYQLLAIDGSDVYIPLNPLDLDTFFSNGGGRCGWNRVHLNALYDVLNHVYIDAIVQPGNRPDERGSLLKMLDRSMIAEHNIVIADRGYPSFNLLAELQLRNQKYVIRFKDPSNYTSLLYNVTLPKTDSYDIDMMLHIAETKAGLEHCPAGISKKIGHQCHFRFFDNETGVFSFCFRVLKLNIGEGKYEYLLTNLDKENFSTEDICELYHMRWGIETAFRELKYTLGLLNFHSKKVDFIMQEIYARLVLYNFCEIITRHVVLHTKSSRKYDYQVNFTMAMRICKMFFRIQNKMPPNPETLIGKYILPARRNRSFARNTKRRNPMSFLYRIA